MTYDMGTHVNYNYIVFNRLLHQPLSLRGGAVTFQFKAAPDTREPGIELKVAFVDLAGNGQEKGAYSHTFSKSGSDHRTGRWIKLSLPLSSFRVYGHPDIDHVNLVQFQATVFDPKSHKKDRGSFCVSRLAVERGQTTGKAK